MIKSHGNQDYTFTTCHIKPFEKVIISNYNFVCRELVKTCYNHSILLSPMGYLRKHMFFSPIKIPFLSYESDGNRQFIQHTNISKSIVRIPSFQLSKHFLTHQFHSGGLSLSTAPISLPTHLSFCQ